MRNYCYYLICITNVLFDLCRIKRQNIRRQLKVVSKIFVYLHYYPIRIVSAKCSYNNTAESLN